MAAGVMRGAAGGADGRVRGGAGADAAGFLVISGRSAANAETFP